jgi:hypothetical protein
MSAADVYRQALAEQFRVGDIATDSQRALERAENELVRRIACRQQDPTPEAKRLVAEALELVETVRAAANEAEAAHQAAKAAATKVAVFLPPHRPRWAWPSRRAGGRVVGS